MSSSRNTTIRSLHDVGAAGWFGGALMGAIALNGASKDVSDPAERSRIAASGWARCHPPRKTTASSAQGPLSS